MSPSDDSDVPDEAPDVPGDVKAPSSSVPPRRFRADAFTLPVPSGDWIDRSLYVLTGATFDGLVHSVTITKESDETLAHDERVQHNVEAVLAELNDARVLWRDEVTLDCGRAAHRAIFVWVPAEERRYLEQFYVPDGPTLYILSAVFTRRSRRRLGANVEQMMRSFDPTS